MGYKTAIQNLLVTTAASGEFVEAVYSTAHPSLLSEGSVILPKSVETNEVRGAFGINDDYGRSFRQERQGWAWLLILRFDTEAVMEYFEKALMENPLTLAHDPANGRDHSVTLLLEDSAYDHPPRGGPSNGTKATYRFVAELSHQ